MDKQLERSTSDVVFSGVCGGLAEYFNIDVTLIRIVFFLSAWFGGGGVLVYLALAVLMPRESSTVEAIVGAELG